MLNRSLRRLAPALAATATFALVGPLAPAQAGEATTTHEKGLVMECTGSIKGRPVYASLYETNVARNVVQILIGRDGKQVGGSRETRQAFRDQGEVFAAMKVGGDPARIKGTARRVGEPVRVHEEHDDAGYHVTIDGTHRRLAPKLVLKWRGAVAPLTCDPAFLYDLQVTKEPVE